MSLKTTAVLTYRTAATLGPETEPQTCTPSYSVSISTLAGNLALDNNNSAPAIRKKK
jgi:hypothetical protein